MCVIGGAHLLLIWLTTLETARRGERRNADATTILVWVDPFEPADSPSSQTTKTKPQLAQRDALRKNGAITLPTLIEPPAASTDWNAEAKRAAGAAERRARDEANMRRFDQHPAGMGPLPPKRSGHIAGDSEHFDGGEIITWVGKGCYYSNLNSPNASLGPALRLQLPTCNRGGGGGRGGEPLQSFEDWKKEKDEQSR